MTQFMYNKPSFLFTEMTSKEGFSWKDQQNVRHMVSLLGAYLEPHLYLYCINLLTVQTLGHYKHYKT